MPSPAKRSRKPSPIEPSQAGLVAWATELVAALEHELAPAPSPPPLGGDPLFDLVARFGLDDTEAAILAVCGAAERSLSLSRRMRALGGSGVITVEVVRAVCEQGGWGNTMERLAPKHRLRAHALVYAPGAEGRLVAASDPLRLEVGLWPQLALGVELDAITSHEPGEPPADRPSFVQRLAGAAPAVLALEGVSAGDEPALAQAIADGTGRRVVSWRAHDAQEAQLLRLRRDVDRVGAILVVSGAAVPLAPLLGPPPARPAAAPMIVVLGAVEDKTVRAPFSLRRDKVGPQARELAPISETDRIRALAQRDADRALGRIRPEPPPRVVVPGKIVETSVRLAETRAEPAAPPGPVTAAERVATTQSTTSPETVAAPEPATTATAAPTATPVEDDTAPRIELPADASPEMRARAAMNSQSASQRIELLRSLAGIKTNAVVTALRYNLRSEHAPLREVAESMMTQLFGASWNKSRAITPPVQTPPSDDGGRGPGGAF